VTRSLCREYETELDYFYCNRSWREVSGIRRSRQRSSRECVVQDFLSFDEVRKYSEENAKCEGDRKEAEGKFDANSIHSKIACEKSLILDKRECSVRSSSYLFNGLLLRVSTGSPSPPQHLPPMLARRGCDPSGYHNPSNECASAAHPGRRENSFPH